MPRHVLFLFWLGVIRIQSAQFQPEHLLLALHTSVGKCFNVPTIYTSRTIKITLYFISSDMSFTFGLKFILYEFEAVSVNKCTVLQGLID